MLEKDNKNGISTLVKKAMGNENIGICPVCNKKIKNDDFIARKIDGLWLCSISCIDKFLKEKKKWTPAEWHKLCSMQAFYEEQKRVETNHSRKELMKSGFNSLVSR